MVKDNKYGQMELATMVVGMKTKFKAMVNLYMLIRMNMKVNFTLIEQMELEDMYKSAVKHTKDFGLMTSLMEKVN